MKHTKKHSIEKIKFKCLQVIGLKNATEEEIKALHTRYPLGYHKTHGKDGTKLGCNGVFITNELAKEK